MNRLLRNWRVVVRDMSYAAGVRIRALPVRRGHDAFHAAGAPVHVVLVPGVYESWHFMVPLARTLAARGHDVHLVPALGINRRPIPAAAATVAEYVAEHDLRDVVLVGHSKGGLIGKHAMLLDDPDGRIARLVAVASPFLGSAYARWMLAPALRTFRPTAPTLAMLAAERDVNARITSIYPEFDPHIPEGSELPGAHNIEVPVRGHFRVLVEPWALRTVVGAVEGRFVTTPTTEAPDD